MTAILSMQKLIESALTVSKKSLAHKLLIEIGDRTRKRNVSCGLKPTVGLIPIGNQASIYPQ